MVNAVGGTCIHYGMESWRLSPYNFKTRSATVKRYGAGAHPLELDARRLADRLRRRRAVLRPGRVPDRRLRQGRQHPRQARTAAATCSKARAGASTRTAAAAPLGLDGADERHARSGSSWQPFPGPAAILLAAVPTACPACDYCGFCTYNGCHTNAKGSTFLNAIPRAERTKNLQVVPRARVTRAARRQGRAGARRALLQGQGGVHPARRRGDPLGVPVREHPAPAAVEVEARTGTGSPTTTARSASTTSATCTAAWTASSRASG